jgi:type IV secretion system protein VirB1
MSAAAVALSTLLSQCAPNVGERTMTAIVRVESNANPLAIYDNTSGRSFAPRTIAEAMYTARTLIDAGHSVDLGLAQVNSANLQRLGMEIRDAFDPCSNLHGAATILETDYAAAASQFSPGPYALRRAIGAYNSGSIYGGGGYVDRILIAAGLPPQGSRRIPDLEAPSAMPAAVTFANPVTIPGPTLAQPAAVRVQAPPKPKPKPPNPFAAPILVMSSRPVVHQTLFQASQISQPAPVAQPVQLAQPAPSASSPPSSGKQ